MNKTSTVNGRTAEKFSAIYKRVATELVEDTDDGWDDQETCPKICPVGHADLYLYPDRWTARQFYCDIFFKGHLFASPFYKGENPTERYNQRLLMLALAATVADDEGK